MGVKRFLLIVDGIADAAFAVDGGGCISAWNKAAVDLFGVIATEAIGVRCHNILQCGDENEVVSSERCIIARVARDNCARSHFDLQLQTKTGKQWCNLSTLIGSDPVSGQRHTVYIVRPCEIWKRLEQAFSEFVRTQNRYGLNGVSTISPVAAPAINNGLTSREIEVLKRLAKGDSTRTIANQLNISSATVNNHVKHILTKFDAHTRLEAIRHAESTGMI
ncbi:MAG TPA: LuxR C-terminal-related transcriptional regulator [Pyrinomonadaceae bacterium]|jgi:PAS domain S-box-containing protein|nr:LuxR C-terminal-related transcriptional regulator [Pyrinomonadaceae bacterium]